MSPSFLAAPTPPSKSCVQCKETHNLNKFTLVSSVSHYCYSRHELRAFYDHAARTNDIFILVAKAVAMTAVHAAHLLQSRQEQQQSQHLQQQQGHQQLQQQQQQQSEQQQPEQQQPEVQQEKKEQGAAVPGADGAPMSSILNVMQASEGQGAGAAQSPMLGVKCERHSLQGVHASTSACRSAAAATYVDWAMQQVCLMLCVHAERTPKRSHSHIDMRMLAVRTPKHSHT